MNGSNCDGNFSENNSITRSRLAVVRARVSRKEQETTPQRRHMQLNVKTRRVLAVSSKAHLSRFRARWTFVRWRLQFGYERVQNVTDAD
uniref:Uncharacterized protein n=1 Tax=Parascaris equorum TaxID=6256 RepID=A0A914SGH4_PAREQ